MTRLIVVVISMFFLSSCSEMTSGLLKMSPQGASVSAGHDTYGGLSVNATINFRPKGDESNKPLPKTTPPRGYEGKAHYTPRY